MPTSRPSRKEESKSNRIAPPPSATKAIMAVVEVCSVPYEDAYRVLQSCDMDVQAAIERFLNGMFASTLNTLSSRMFHRTFVAGERVFDLFMKLT